MSRSLKAHILLVLVTFAWGATFVSVKDALTNVSPLLFNFLRMASASVALVAVFWREMPRLTHISQQKRDMGHPNGPVSMIMGGTLLGIFLWAGYSFQTVGLKYTTPSKSAFITGMAVVLVPLIVAISGRRLPNRWTVAGVLSAFAGLYLMTIPSSEGFSLAGINRGDLLTIGCPVSFALHIYTMGKLMQRYSFKPIAVMQVAVATLLMGATIPLERLHFVATGEAIFAILFTGLICTAAAFSIQAWAQQFTPPTHTALIFVLEPVFAALTSYVLLGEHLGTRGTVGATLIFSGILVSELRGSSVEPPSGPVMTKGSSGNAEFSIN
jgi:drug/metabolite transporter (DMT)-like permease